MATPTEQLAYQIEALRRRVDGLKTPQLASSSIDNGSMTVTQTQDGSQQVTTVIGQQYDGTSGAVVVAGPTPPVPTMPTLTGFIGGVKVRWDGHFADPQSGFTSPVVAPLDFAGVDVHVSSDPSFPEVGFGTNHGSIVSAAGGEVFVPWPVSGTQLYARLVTRSKAGKFSNPGLTAGPTPSGLVQLGDLGFSIAQYSGGNTIYFTVSPTTPTAPSWGFTAGDLWLDQTATSTGANGNPPAGTPLYQTYRWLGSSWVLLQDQGISNSLASAITAQQLAAAKTTTFTQATAPSYSGAASTALWVDTSNGNRTMVWSGTTWVAYQLGNGAIQPNSLIASNVIATGTVTAALLEANLVLATTLIAGDVRANHATMQADGFHIFQVVTAAQGLVEVARLATGSNNFFGLVDSTGTMKASIDETGQGNFTDLNVTNEPVFQGQMLSALIAGEAPQQVGYFECNVPANTGAGFGDYGPITSRVGIMEVNARLQTGHRYGIRFKSSWFAVNVPAECRYTLVYAGPTSSGSDTASTPSTTSTTVDQFLFPANYSGGWQTAAGETTFVPTTSGRHRFLLCIELGAAPGQPSGAEVFVVSALKNIAVVQDSGAAVQITGVQTQAGGAFFGGSPPAPTPPPTQQYDTGFMAPAGWATYRGNGTLRTDTTDVVQGWDPSGYNGDGKGHWWFTIPNITGTVNRVDFYAESNHTYYNSGGQSLISPTQLNVGGPGYNQVKPQWNPGINWPKPGSNTVTLPSDWWQYYSANGVGGVKFDGVRMGPSGGTNETYYVRFNGSTARLRIWYTQ